MSRQQLPTWHGYAIAFLLGVLTWHGLIYKHFIPYPWAVEQPQPLCRTVTTCEEPKP